MRRIPGREELEILCGVDWTIYLMTSFIDFFFSFRCPISLLAVGIFEYITMTEKYKKDDIGKVRKERD